MYICIYKYIYFVSKYDKKKNKHYAKLQIVL